MKKAAQLLLLVLPFSFLIGSAQTKSKLRKTIRGEFQLPKAISNKAFTNSFSGVFNMGVSMNFSGKHLTAGGFYSLTQYQVFPKYLSDAHPILTNHTAGIKLSYDMLTSTGKGMWSPFLSPGYTWLKYTRIKPKNHLPGITNPRAMSLHAGVTYNIMMDEWTGAGFTFGYNIVNHVYRPENICMDEWGNYTEDQKKGILQNIFFGFSVYFDLAWKPETAE
jgi:hypothetical protein